MAYIKNLGFFAQLRSESSNHIVRFRNGRVVQSGRGITFWFWPENASISEVPMDDREMTVFVKGRSLDFQANLFKRPQPPVAAGVYPRHRQPTERGSCATSPVSQVLPMKPRAVRWCGPERDHVLSVRPTFAKRLLIDTSA